MRIKAHLTVLVAFAAILISCGKDETKGTTPATRPEAPRETVPCETAWAKLVEAMKVGTIATYTTTSTTDVPGSAPLTTKSERIETVTEVTPEQYAFDSVTKTLTPAPTPEQKVTITVKKADFIQGCKTPAPAPEGFKMEVLEEKDESVTVPAGTFASNYRKTKLTDADGKQETLSEMWMGRDDTNRLLKMMTLSSITEGATTTKTTMITELIKLELP